MVYIYTCIEKKGMTILNYFIRNVSNSNRVLTMTCLTEIKTFVFLDLETTGLPQMENNRTKITELCMVAVQADHIRLGVFPRVQNKLNFCFNPWKLISADAEKITGLTNNLLEHQSKFSAETVNAINTFLNHNPKPVCLVAHNGDYFDYPILRKEIEKTENSLLDDVICVDSLKAFRDVYFEDNKTEIPKSEAKSSVPVEFTDIYDSILCDSVVETEGGVSQKVLEAKRLNETTPKKQIFEAFPTTSSSKKLRISSSQRQNFDISFKLTEVYTRLTQKSPINEHQAEGDVLMLITCAATLGDKFVEWANVNVKKFCDIPPMVPGKKIGSGE